MSRRTQETLATLAFLGVFLGLAWLSLDFGPRARMIPLPLALFGALLAIVQLVLQQRGATQSLKMDLINVDPPAPAADSTGSVRAPGDSQPAPGRSSAHKVLGAYAIVGGLLVMILTIGPVASVFLFTAGYFLKTRYYSAPFALAYAAAFTLTVYLLFFVALQIQPYYGMLGPLIARFN